MPRGPPTHAAIGDPELRWVARFCVERSDVTLADVQSAAWAFENISDEPAALESLQRLCSR